MWPIPEHYNISSFFGKRTSPTSGASTYHSGIDIPAPEGTKLVAVDDGNVYFASWGAGGGYTISYQLINHPDIAISYCHVSPVFYVSIGDKIHKNQVIGTVGPKNVYGISNNPYRDSNGNPTNGASTGSHLHFTIKVNSQAVNPLDYYSI
ncbi:MAG: M23 family metallopeptidase [Clostridia bacterium]|nr:M23 family metallopeptidase [Clostridia bacterium]